LVAIRSEGVPDGNPQHPKLLALIAAGAEIGEFVDAARLAQEKGFAYLLAVVEGRRRDAEKIAANARASPSPVPPRRKTVSDERRETYEVLTGKRPANPEKGDHEYERDISGECERIA
jgi:hypothetical protein